MRIYGVGAPCGCGYGHPARDACAGRVGDPLDRTDERLGLSRQQPGSAAGVRTRAREDVQGAQDAGRQAGFLGVLGRYAGSA
jgi:hypothetical protein